MQNNCLTRIWISLLKHVAKNELLHLKYLQPQLKICWKCLTKEVWIVNWIFFLCDFYIKLITEGLNILSRSAKRTLITWPSHSVCMRCFKNSSTGGVRILNEVAQRPHHWKKNNLKKYIVKKSMEDQNIIASAQSVAVW